MTDRTFDEALKENIDLTLLLTPEDAAARLSIGRSSLYELLLSKEIESIKIGRSRRVPIDALASYIERKRLDPDA